MWLSRWSRLLLALLVCVAALGCGSSAGKGGAGSAAQGSDAAAGDAAAPQSNGTPGSPGGGPQGQSGGAPGAPTNRKSDSVAAGAPVKIPAFQENGQPMYEPPQEPGGEPGGAKLDFEHDVRDACKGGTMCLNVQVRPSDADLETCLFDHLEYPEGTKLGDPQNAYNYDGSKVAQSGDTVWMVCNPQSSTDSGGPSQDTSGSTDSSQPQPTDTTAPPDSSQP